MVKIFTRRTLQRKNGFHKTVVILFLFLAISTNCKETEEEASTKRKKGSAATEAADGTENAQKKALSAKELAQTFLPGERGLPFDDSQLPKIRIRKGKLDPRKARATITKIEIGSTGLSKDKKHNVPIITFDLGNSDYVKIIRCAAIVDDGSTAGHKLIDASGQYYENITGERKDKEEAGRDAWLIAIADYRRCKIISGKSDGKGFMDIAAKTGSWYYVINPCIKKLYDTRCNRDCSRDP